MHPGVNAFFDEATNTISYIVAEPQGKVCAVIDSVLDYDPKSGRTSTKSADKLITFLKDPGNPRACGPPDRGALFKGEGRRQDRHR